MSDIKQSFESVTAEHNRNDNKQFSLRSYMYLVALFEYKGVTCD